MKDRHLGSGHDQAALAGDRVFSTMPRRLPPQAAIYVFFLFAVTYVVPLLMLAHSYEIVHAHLQFSRHGETATAQVVGVGGLRERGNRLAEVGFVADNQERFETLDPGRARFDPVIGDSVSIVYLPGHESQLRLASDKDGLFFVFPLISLVLTIPAAVHLTAFLRERWRRRRFPDQEFDGSARRAELMMNITEGLGWLLLYLIVVPMVWFSYQSTHTYLELTRHHATTVATVVGVGEPAKNGSRSAEITFTADGRSRTEHLDPGSIDFRPTLGDLVTIDYVPGDESKLRLTGKSDGSVVLLPLLTLILTTLVSIRSYLWLRYRRSSPRIPSWFRRRIFHSR